MGAHVLVTLWAGPDLRLQWGYQEKVEERLRRSQGTRREEKGSSGWFLDFGLDHEAYVSHGWTERVCVGN